MQLRAGEMKNSKMFAVMIIRCMFVLSFCLAALLHAMEISQKFTPKRIHLPEQSRRYKSDIVWVKTSDNALMELTQWQTDQMRALHQIENNSKDNPINASMVSGSDLALIRKALENARNLDEFKIFCSNLSQDQQTTLVAGAFTLEMQGLASLLLTYIFPKDVQAQMGASAIQPAGIIAPIIDYLKINAEQIPLNHKGTMQCIAVSPDGRRIISGAGGIDHNLILYDVHTGKEIRNLYEGHFLAKCVAFSSDGQYIATGAGRIFDNLIIWNGKTGERIRILNQFEGHFVSCVDFSPDGKYMIVGSNQKRGKNNLILFDIKTWDAIESFQGPIGFDGSYMAISSVAFHPDGKHIVVGSPEYHHVMICDAQSGTIIKTFDGLSKGNIRVAISSDGKYMAGGSSHQEGLLYHSHCLLWNLEMSTLIKDIDFGRSISCIAFSPDGYYLVAGSWSISGLSGHPLHLYNGTTGESIKSVLDVFNGQVADVAFSLDNNYLYCATKNGLWVFKMIAQETLEFIATQLNIAQAGLLYRLYVAKMNNVRIVLDQKDLDYQIFKTLPVDVQKVVKVFLPFELVSDVVKKIKKERSATFEKAIVEKMNEYRSSLFYGKTLFFEKYEKKLDEKIKAVKDAMQKLNKDSIEYKACERLLNELEQAAAFI